MRESPHSVAMGLSVGVFVGCLPIIPFQTVVALGLAFVIRCNKIAAAAGTWITNPLYAPFVYYGLYRIGKMIIPIGKKEFEPEDLTLMNIVAMGWDFFLLMMFGGIIVGLILSVITYMISVKAVKVYHDRRAKKKSQKKLQGLTRSRGRI
ncbi:MAG: DUF2062 domain-containing protein [Desulfonatronovibrio sp. MSAO_Bac4]|nr:MAG: DUF2062 domain-containing protein [Desulfonatronovibrio sp. MSAO_Bac4]